MQNNVRLVCPSCGILKLTEDQLNNLKVGDYIKLLDNGERFWAQIVLLCGDTLKAKVNNDLINAHAFKCDDIITVTKTDIIGLIDEKGNPI